MEEDLGECLVLRMFLGEEPSCLQTCTRGRFPSYHDMGRGRGCWVAHTALCILEALRVKNEVTTILNRRNIRWRTLILTLLLHDFGKLSKNYVSRSRLEIRHNEVSAQIAYDVLTELEKANHVDGEEKEIVSQACFLHMEYYLWRSMIKGGFTTISQLTSPSMVVELADGVEEPLENLKLVLKDVGVLEEPVFLVISKAARIRKVKLVPSNYTVIHNWARSLKTISLQWFILLFDNRASSARRGVNSYWSILLKEAMKLNSEAKPDAEKITRFSDYSLSKLRGRLTPLPRTNPITLEFYRI